MTILKHNHFIFQDKLPYTSHNMRLILDMAAVPINYCSADLRILFANKAHAELHGFLPEQIIGKTIVEVLGKEGNEAIRPYYERALRGEQVQYEMEVDFKIGRRYIECVYNPIFNEDGRVEGWVGVINNMTERHQLETALQEKEETLRHALEKAEAANIAKSEFLANMSHEIRTPMNAIVGLSDILERGIHPERQKEFLKALRLSANQLLDLINDLLDISKIENRYMELEQIDFDINQLLAEIISVHNVKAVEKGITLHLEVLGNVPDRLVGDPLRLKQVVVNLVSNAIKFTEKGGVTISVHCQPENNGNVALRIEIQDSGIGIREEQIDSIFGKFTQADTSITRKYGGTGLGLAICKKLMEMMGGAIEVSSVYGQGSCFAVLLSLPMAKGGQIVYPLFNTLPTQAAPIQRQPRGHVLLVEDYKANIIVATALLDQLGCTYSVVQNGREALDILERQKFDLILLDVQMPELDGFETAHFIRLREKQRGKSRIAIIGITAHALAGDRERCLQSGMDDYIPKPFRPDEFEEKLAKHLPKQPAYNAAV